MSCSNERIICLKRSIINTSLIHTNIRLKSYCFHFVASRLLLNYSAWACMQIAMRKNIKFNLFLSEMMCELVKASVAQINSSTSVNSAMRSTIELQRRRRFSENDGKKSMRTHHRSNITFQVWHYEKIFIILSCSIEKSVKISWNNDKNSEISPFGFNEEKNIWMNKSKLEFNIYEALKLHSLLKMNYYTNLNKIIRCY